MAISRGGHIRDFLLPGLRKMQRPDYAALNEADRSFYEARARLVREHTAKLDRMAARGLTADGIPYDYKNKRYVDERLNGKGFV